jgi:hypothetical protein
MDASSKRGALASFSVAVAAAIVIAAGLPGLRFSPGHPLPALDDGSVLLERTGAGSGLALPVDRFVAAAALLMAAIALVAALLRSISAIGTRGMGRFLLKALGLVAAASLVLYALLASLPHVIGKTSVEAAAPPPPAVFDEAPPAADPPAILYWALGAAAAGAVIALCLRIAYARGAEEREGLELIAMEAEAARLGIRSGGSLGDAIIACYRRMGRVVTRERGVERSDSMTAREFEEAMIAAGIDEEGVRGLTRLFEAVRYGRALPAARDEEEALRCLGLIEDSARAGRKRP